MLKSVIHAPMLLKGWFLYLILFPFYFFKAGQPQISDYFIALVLISLVFQGKLTNLSAFKSILSGFRNLVLYIGIVNIGLAIATFGVTTKGIAWYFVLAFYVFNFLIFNFAFYLYLKYKKMFLQVSLAGIILSCAVPILLSPLAPSSGGFRDILFFANPNQLGYFSLCAVTIYILLKKTIHTSLLLDIGVFGMGLYMAALSLSKAAIFSIIILSVAYFIENGILSIRNFTYTVLLFIFGIIGFSTTDFGQNFIENFDSRLIENNERLEKSGVTEFEYRGYDRMVNHPGYLILGAGEGAYDRFDTYIENHEIHSSLGTILFCYGIPGSILFIIFIIRLFKGLTMNIKLYAIPIFAYGVTHMGLRFTVFWIALALFPILRAYSEEYFSNPKKYLPTEHQISH